MENERAPEITALDHPNSLCIGMKKTPYVLNSPHMIIWSTPAAAATT